MDGRSSSTIPVAPVEEYAEKESVEKYHEESTEEDLGSVLKLSRTIL